MLITREASASGEGERDGAQGGGDGVAFEELKSFTTQAFFLCWRSLHVGLLQVEYWDLLREARVHKSHRKDEMTYSVVCELSMVLTLPMFRNAVVGIWKPLSCM